MAQWTMVQDLSQPLARLLQNELGVLRALPETTSQIRPAAEHSWSPKEELGHLIDSASNNHIRFVRAIIEPEFSGPSYAQNDWVRVHRYQEMPWLTIVDFWYQYNSFIATLLTQVPQEKLATVCYVGSGAGVSLEFLVDDYVLHMQHHVDHLLARKVVTPYPA